MNYYQIAPTKLVRAESAVFTYQSDQPLESGQVVTIPVGKSNLVGIVIKKVSQPSFATKPVSGIVTEKPLPKELLDTLIWMSAYYASHLSLALSLALPRGITSKRRATTSKFITPVRDRTNYLLNQDQQNILDEISKINSGTIILNGITGSGKTEVYKRLARRALAKNKSVIIITPEIALTAQLTAEFSELDTSVVVTHSGQTEAERHILWLEILNSNKPMIIIGPRSALFAPVNKLGLIIIDEAHEPSLKQDKSPRYSSLRVASVLAKNHKIPFIQGSATPLVAEYYLAKNNHGEIFSLPKKADPSAVASTIKLIDMTKQQNFTKHRFLSDRLLADIEANLKAGDQSLIFHNRRGSASATICKQCGWSADCPNCFIPLTLHADKHQLYCHICSHSRSVPTSCPACKYTDIVHKGIGTKLIESELSRIFPEAHIARFDADTAKTNTVEQLYQDLYDAKIDIIIGTQVIAKGLDLPKLRTVGIVQADTGLSLPDYSSSERTFQLLSQAIGRVGRSSAATSAIVQAYNLDAPAVKFGVQQDFTGFYDHALPVLKQANFPPFSFLLKLTCIYKTERSSINNSRKLAKQLSQKYPKVKLFGPTPAFRERVGDTYRWQIVVKSNTRQTLLDIIHNDLPSSHWQFDIDPYNLL